MGFLFSIAFKLEKSFHIQRPNKYLPSFLKMFMVWYSYN